MRGSRLAKEFNIRLAVTKYQLAPFGIEAVAAANPLLKIGLLGSEQVAHAEVVKNGCETHFLTPARPNGQAVRHRAKFRKGVQDHGRSRPAKGFETPPFARTEMADEQSSLIDGKGRKSWKLSRPKADSASAVQFPANHANDLGPLAAVRDKLTVDRPDLAEW